MTVAHLLVTLIYMPKEIIHNITVGWWGGDLVSLFNLRYYYKVSTNNFKFFLVVPNLQIF